MVRPPLGPNDRRRGLALGAALRAARGQRSMVEVAALAGVSVETVRKIERGRVPTPAFFTVAALAEAVGLPLADLCQDVTDATRVATGPHDTRAAS
jgi:transcriptional regulator with XRE-family HTH domain